MAAEGTAAGRVGDVRSRTDLRAAPDACEAELGPVHVGCDVALRPGPGMAAYAAAKAGVRLLATAIALDLAPDGIRVCCVAACEDSEPTAEDVAASVAFCAFDEASDVLGSTFFPDGPLPYRG